MSRPTISIDCDGVLLDWINQYKNHNENMRWRGYDDKIFTTDSIEIFNQTLYVQNLNPVRTSKTFVDKLKKHYDFHVISCIGGYPHHYEARLTNLKKVFGEDFPKSLVCLPYSSSKAPSLKRAKRFSDIWIEDNLENAIEGTKLGFHTLYLKHNHNMKAPENSGVIEVYSWKEIYEKIRLYYK